MLEINEGTVKSRLSTSRAKMIRAALEEKEKKEGIKLYVIPLALIPILRQAIKQMSGPDGLAERMWENMQRAEAETVESISNIAAVSVKTGGAVLSTKAIALIVGGVILAAAIAATFVFWPRSSEIFSPNGDIPSVVEETSTDETADDIHEITMSSWTEQNAGASLYFYE